MSEPETTANSEANAAQSVDAALDSVTGETPSAAAPPLDWLAVRAKLEGELREANDRTARALAELENYRKRSRREMEDERRYAALPLIRDLLNVMDNLDRAMESAEKNQNISGLLEGVKMVAMQFQTYLEQNGCKRIPAVGLPFDPHQHEAVAQEPSAELAAGMVTRITRHGYQLHERVVRPSQVLVSVGPPSPPAG